MSYHVQVFRREVQTRFEQANDKAFFEKSGSLTPFTKKDIAKIASRLGLVGFAEGKRDKRGQHFSHEEWAAEAVLTDSGLYLSGSGEAILEIGMLASELSGKDLAKFDPQEGSWE